jgi:hypothetical protein
MTVTATRVPESPAGARLPRRSWRDPRLVLGVVLVLLSMGAVVVVVRASDDRVSVWAARDDVVAGSTFEGDEVVAVRVQLPDLGPYVSASTPLEPGTTAARDVAAGELLTDVALHGPAEPRDVRVVTLPVLRNQMPSDLAAGDRVDVYVVERDGGGAPAAPPEQVLAAVSVASVDADGGAFGGTSLEVGVALAVPDDEVPVLVAAQAKGTVTLVDVPVGSG